MQRLIVLALLLLAHTAPAVSRQQRPAGSADSISQVLQELERSLAGGRVADFRALATREISAEAVARVSAAIGAEPNDRSIVRERLRRPSVAGFDVVADVLVGRGPRGRLATWILTLVPDPAAPFRLRIADVDELAALPGLIRLRLDTTRQYAVKNLTLTAPDFVLTMESGSAFVAESGNGPTALVLRGKGRVEFTPKDPTEQQQLRLFSFRPTFRTETDAVYMRFAPAEFGKRVPEGALTPVPVQPREAERAQELFDDFATRSFSLDLRTLTTDQWSLEPAADNVLFEFKTSHGWLTYARSPGDAEDISLFDRAGNHNICHYSSADTPEARTRGYSEDEAVQYDIEHYMLDLAFDPARTWIAGRGAIRVRVLAPSIATLMIRLAPALVVSSVTSPELGELLAIRVGGSNNLLIGLPDSLRSGTRFTIEVAYAGRLPPQLIDRETIGIQGGQTGQAGQDRSQADEIKLMVTPEARYMYSTRAPWYPQGLTTDYATAEMRMTVPATHQVVASGRLIASSTSAAQSGQSEVLATSQFVADRPVRYLAFLVSRLTGIGRQTAEDTRVAPALESPLVATGVNVEVLATPRIVNRNKQTVERAAAMVRFFGDLVGESPYPNMTVAALEDNLPGGHSPAYLVALHQPLPSAPYTWANDPVAFDTQYPWFFLAHEVAHQWWGQAIGLRNYHDQWLSEGLAQYFAVLFAAHDRGPQMLDTLLGMMRASSRPMLNQGPVTLGYRIGHIRNDSRVNRGILYNKSAIVLHMLRRYIGDEAFFAGIRKFYADRRFSKAGTADLLAAMEAASGVELDRFFDAWIRGFAVPRIRLSSRMEDDGRTAVIRVEQPHQPFDFPLTVSVQFADGRTELRTLKVTGTVFEDTMSVTSPVRRVTIRDDFSYFETIR